MLAENLLLLVRGKATVAGIGLKLGRSRRPHTDESLPLLQGEEIDRNVAAGRPETSFYRESSTARNLAIGRAGRGGIDRLLLDEDEWKDERQNQEQGICNDQGDSQRESGIKARRIPPALN